MNCRDFANDLPAIAHDQTVEPLARKRALAHTENCARCARQLAEARVIAAGVRGVKAEIAGQQAPARVEATLRQAFRKRAAAPKRSKTVPAPTRAPRWSRRAIGMAAALILISALLTSAFWYQLRQSDHSLNRVAVAAASSPNQVDRWMAMKTRVEPVKPPSGPGTHLKRAPQVIHPREADRVIARGSKPAGDAPSADEETHALTDFILLTVMSAETAMDSGQVIRVKVPLSTFFALGVAPLGAEHADKLVNAEIVVGDDGVQRAIRLVK